MRDFAERGGVMGDTKLRHYCRNPRCRSKLPTPVESEHHAFCTRGCVESFYRSRCRVCERRLDIDPMTGAKLSANNRRYCGRKCRLKARDPLRSAPDSLPRRVGSRSAHFTGLEMALEANRARIRAPAHVIDTEMWAGRKWQPATSSDGVAIEVGHLRPRALKEAA